MDKETPQKEVGDLLLEEGTLTEKQLEQVRRRQRRLDVPQHRAVLELNYASEESTYRALATLNHLEFVEPENVRLNTQLLEVVPVKLVFHYHMVPLALDGELLSVAFSEPLKQMEQGNLRLLLGYMYAEPGKKLLFMGGEFGQWREWNHDRQLDWDLLQEPQHRQIQKWVTDLNSFYAGHKAMSELDHDPNGFEWIDSNDAEQSVLSFIRKGATSSEIVLVVCNFTPVPRNNYRVGSPRGGYWTEVLNSDATAYGGSGTGNTGGVWADAIPLHNRPFSLGITLPPLAILFFESKG